jgi:acyl-coenzyme A thioesterase PaaI-like protein
MFWLNLWPPFRAARIRVRRISADWREIDVEMRLGLFNRNYMGSHFGGSLFAMSDPFFWLIVQRVLGREYIVSHKGGRIDFLTPGYGTVRVAFRVSDGVLAEIRAGAVGEERWIGEFSTEILNEQDEVVARPTQILHIRKRQPE